MVRLALLIAIQHGITRSIERKPCPKRYLLMIYTSLEQRHSLLKLVCTLLCWTAYLGSRKHSCNGGYMLLSLIASHYSSSLHVKPCSLHCNKSTKASCLLSVPNFIYNVQKQQNCYILDVFSSSSKFLFGSRHWFILGTYFWRTMKFTHLLDELTSSDLEMTYLNDWSCSVLWA